MAIHLADVTIHIDETLDQIHLEQLRDQLLEQAGVMAAVYRMQRRHLMIVGYDPNRNSAVELLKVIRRQGLGAELIGL